MNDADKKGGADIVGKYRQSTWLNGDTFLLRSCQVGKTAKGFDWRLWGGLLRRNTAAVAVQMSDLSLRDSKRKVRKRSYRFY